jgi:hypothetical protein
MRALVAHPSIVVAVHLAVVLVHGAAHQRLGVDLDPWQNVFVWVVILIGPLVALGLVHLPGQRKRGFGLLAITMAGSLLFGVYFHFIKESSDHVGHREHDAWGLVFTISAVLLAVIEALGCWIGLQGMSTRRTP